MDEIVSDVNQYQTSVLVYKKNLMATSLHIKVELPDSTDESSVLNLESEILKCFQLGEDLENDYSEFRESSCVYQLNHSKKDEWISISNHFLTIFKKCLLFYEGSNGHFDPGFRGDTSIPLFYRYELDEKNLKIKRKDYSFLIGFGAIGKGYAVDEIVSHLKKTELSKYPLVVDLGGSSLYFSEKTYSSKLSSMGWAFGKSSEGSYLGFECFSKSKQEHFIGVSGSMEKGNHILSPLSKSQKNDKTPLSVFVSSKNALFSDAYSTSLFHLFTDKEYSILNAKVMKDSDFVAVAKIDQNYIPSWNHHFRNQWKTDFLNEDQDEKK